MTDLRPIAQKAKQSVNLSDVVRQHVHDLKETRPAGDWKALCPFHSEKTPSFTVHDSGEHAGTYKCFGCGASGDHIKFLQEIKGLNFPAAVKELCSIAGIPFPSTNGSAKPRPPKKKADPDGWGDQPLQNEFASQYGLTIKDFTDAGITFDSPRAEWFKKNEILRAYPKDEIPTAIYPLHNPDGTLSEAKKCKTVARYNGKREQWFRPSGYPKGIFGFQDLESCEGKILVWTGGEEKKLAANKAGFKSCSYEEKCPPKDIIQAIQTAKPSKVIIAYDADETGETAAIETAKAFDMAGLDVYVIHWPSDLHKGFDLNNYLVEYGVERLTSFIASAKKFAQYESLSPGDWENAPVTIEGETPELPSIDHTLLPDWISDFSEYVAHETQTPVDMSIITSMAVISTALMGHIRVRARGSWKEHPNLFAAVIAQPSERKSAVFAFCTKPLYTREDIEVKQAKDKRIHAKNEQRRIKTEIDSFRGANQNPAVQQRINDLKAQLEDFKNPVTDPHLAVDDATPEKLAMLMEENEGKMAYFSSEGEIFENVAASLSNSGRYGYKPTIFLKGFSGERFDAHRVQRESVRINRALLSMGISVQPSVFENLKGSREIAGKGFFARFLYSIPESKVGHRNTWPEEIPIDPVRIYNENILKLFEDMEDVHDHTINLSPEAESLFREFAENCEAQLRSSGRLRDIQSWGGRLATLGLKIATIMFAAQNVNRTRWWTLPIDAQSMRQGCYLAWSYAIEHAREAFRLMGIMSFTPSEAATEIINWIIESGSPAEFLPQFRKSEATVALKHKLQASEINVALQSLIEYDYIRESDKTTKTRGRRATVYEVNPRILDALKNDDSGGRK